MKKVIFAGFAALTCMQAIGQNVYKTDFPNLPTNKIEIQAASDDVQIIGHDRNEIIIETTAKPEQRQSAESIFPGGEREERPGDKERAQGLKPLTSAGADNTGIGLTIQKTDNKFTVVNVRSSVSGKYIFKIPNKVNLTVNEIKPWAKSAYEITGLRGELNINALNSAFVIKNVSGPVVMQNTNGSIEIVYDKLAPEKPNSLTTVNGFIDITFPVDVKADININAINGSAFTDFDIKVKTEDVNAVIPPIAPLQVFNLTGSINGGGVPFTVSAVNGDVYIRKGK